MTVLPTSNGQNSSSRARPSSSVLAVLVRLFSLDPSTTVHPSSALFDFASQCLGSDDGQETVVHERVCRADVINGGEVDRPCRKDDVTDTVSPQPHHMRGRHVPKRNRLYLHPSPRLDEDQGTRIGEDIPGP
jgi:hypothetical protein